MWSTRFQVRDTSLVRTLSLAPMVSNGVLTQKMYVHIHVYVTVYALYHKYSIELNMLVIATWWILSLYHKHYLRRINYLLAKCEGLASLLLPTANA